MFITTCFKILVSKEEKEQILKLMRNFSSAVRSSYKRLLEGFTPSQAYKITRQKFPELNSHYVNCAKEPVRGPENGRKLWRVLRVAFAIPLLGRSFSRDLSPLRPVMVQGKWEGIASRLGPDGFAGPP